MAEAPPQNQGHEPQPDLEQHLLQASHRVFGTEKHYRVCLQINQNNFNDVYNTLWEFHRINVDPVALNPETEMLKWHPINATCDIKNVQVQIQPPLQGGDLPLQVHDYSISILSTEHDSTI